MLYITADFRAARTKKEDKAGVVFFRIYEKAPKGDMPDSESVSADAGKSRRLERKVNSDITGADKSVLVSERDAIIRGLKLLYCVIERLANAGQYTIDDVADSFRLALAGDESMRSAIDKSRTDFAINPDLVAIGSAFRNDFRYVSPSETDGRTFNGFILDKIQELKSRDRMSMARSYISTLHSISDFAGSKILEISDINPGWIRAYEASLKESGIAASTVSFYMRTLRLILNQMAREGLLTVGDGWFKDVETSVHHDDRTVDRRILSREELKALSELPLYDNEPLDMARDMFMFGFYCRGMELVDIANLSSSNIRGNYLVFRKRMKGVEQRVPIEPSAMDIIDKYRGKSLCYIFPLLDNARGILFSSVRNSVCRSIKSVGNLIGIPELSFSMNITTWRSFVSETMLADKFL